MFLALPIAAAAQDADALAAQAEAHAAAGDSAAAAAAYAAAIAADPARRSEWRRVPADHSAWSDSAAEAAQLYREVAEDPALPEQERALARRRLGLALLWSGQPAAAIPWLRRALAAEPDDPELRRSLADALAASGRAERDVEAVADLLLEAGRVDPSRARSLALESADRLLFGRRYEAAEAAYREIVGDTATDREDRRAALLGLARSFAGMSGRGTRCRSTIASSKRNPGSSRVGSAAARHLPRPVIQPLPCDPSRGRFALIRTIRRPSAACRMPSSASARRARERLAPLFADSAPDPDAQLVEARIDLRRGRPDRSEAIVRDLLADEDRLQSWQLSGATRLLDQLMLERMHLGELTVS
jgi:Tfp pilus assembly protein PilF